MNLRLDPVDLCIKYEDSLAFMKQRHEAQCSWPNQDLIPRACSLSQAGTRKAHKHTQGCCEWVVLEVLVGAGHLLETVGQTAYVPRGHCHRHCHSVVQVTSLGDLEKSQQAYASWSLFPSTINVKLQSSLSQGCHKDE